jgi:hypothetical protein
MWSGKNGRIFTRFERAMSDQERTSLDDLLRLAKWNADDQGNGRDGPTAMLRTIYWFRGLQERMGASGAHDLGRMLEPESYWVTDAGVALHRNKWSKYKLGMHVPQSRLVDHVDVVCPGSAHELNHVFWQALRRRPEGRTDIDRLEAGLGIDARKALAAQRAASSRAHAQIDLAFAAKLHKLNCLDSLAAVQLQCERALLARDAVAATQWAKQLQLGMFAHGLELLGHGVARPLMELLNLRLISRTRSPAMSGEVYIDALDGFHASVEMFQDAKVRSYSWTRQQRIFNTSAVERLRLWPWVRDT